jgi:hypothetical protein
MYNFAADCLILQMGTSQGHAIYAITFLDCCFMADGLILQIGDLCLLIGTTLHDYWRSIVGYDDWHT